MLKKTFCHAPGVGTVTETKLWSEGILSWNDFLSTNPRSLSGQKKKLIAPFIESSIERLTNGDGGYFATHLPGAEQWRLFTSFRHSTAYLDIETTGLSYPSDHITTIALYDGKRVECFIRGQNLGDFKERIKEFKLLVTFNGKSFDIPFIEREMGITITAAHIDLRHTLASLGLKGGLKSCERQLGIDREELSGIDGFFAVLLWDDYVRNNNPWALETLLAYNVEDTLNLERIMVMAYNMKIKETPFHKGGVLHAPKVAENPYSADMDTVRRILGRRGGF